MSNPNSYVSILAKFRKNDARAHNFVMEMLLAADQEKISHFLYWTSPASGLRVVEVHVRAHDQGYIQQRAETCGAFAATLGSSDKR